MRFTSSLMILAALLLMSEKSMGFHAATRILGDAINLCRLGQVILHGRPPPSHKPNIKNVSFSSEAASATAMRTK
jgi:hypothetical protein